MDIQIGPHLYRNSNGTIEIEGVPQIECEPRPSGGFPKISFALFDAAGKMPAKLMNGTLSINEGRAYVLERSAASLVMRHHESGKSILHMVLEENGRLVISRGEFYTLKAHLFTITPSEWTLEKTTGQKGETDLNGKAVSLG